MMFVQSLHGISHNKIEDTKEEHLEMAVTAFDKLADKAIRGSPGRAIDLIAGNATRDAAAATRTRRAVR